MLCIFIYINIFQKNLIKYTLNTFIYNTNYMNINIDMNIFSKYILCVCVCVYVCLYICIINILRTHTTFILYAINRD